MSKENNVEKQRDEDLDSQTDDDDDRHSISVAPLLKQFRIPGLITVDLDFVGTEAFRFATPYRVKKLSQMICSGTPKMKNVNLADNLDPEGNAICVMDINEFKKVCPQLVTRLAWTPKASSIINNKDNNKDKSLWVAIDGTHRTILGRQAGLKSWHAFRLCATNFGRKMTEAELDTIYTSLNSDSAEGTTTPPDIYEQLLKVRDVFSKKITITQASEQLSGKCYSKRNLERLRRIVEMFNKYPDCWSIILQFHAQLNHPPRLTVQKLDDRITRNVPEFVLVTFMKMAESDDEHFSSKFPNLPTTQMQLALLLERNHFRAALQELVVTSKMAPNAKQSILTNMEKRIMWDGNFDNFFKKKLQEKVSIASLLDDQDVFNQVTQNLSMATSQQFNFKPNQPKMIDLPHNKDDMDVDVDMNNQHFSRRASNSFLRSTASDVSEEDDSFLSKTPWIDDPDCRIQKDGEDIDTKHNCRNQADFLSGGKQTGCQGGRKSIGKEASKPSSMKNLSTSPSSTEEYSVAGQHYTDNPLYCALMDVLPDLDQALFDFSNNLLDYLAQRSLETLNKMSDFVQNFQRLRPFLLRKHHSELCKLQIEISHAIRASGTQTSTLTKASNSPKAPTNSFAPIELDNSDASEDALPMVEDSCEGNGGDYDPEPVYLHWLQVSKKPPSSNDFPKFLVKILSKLETKKQKENAIHHWTILSQFVIPTSIGDLGSKIRPALIITDSDDTAIGGLSKEAKKKILSDSVVMTISYGIQDRCQKACANWEFCENQAFIQGHIYSYKNYEIKEGEKQVFVEFLTTRGEKPAIKSLPRFSDKLGLPIDHPSAIQQGRGKKHPPAPWWSFADNICSSSFTASFFDPIFDFAKQQTLAGDTQTDLQFAPLLVGGTPGLIIPATLAIVSNGYPGFVLVGADNHEKVMQALVSISISTENSEWGTSLEKFHTIVEEMHCQKYLSGRDSFTSWLSVIPPLKKSKAISHNPHESENDESTQQVRLGKRKTPDNTPVNTQRKKQKKS